MAIMPEEFITVKGARIRVIREGQGKPVFLFHGARFTADTWVSTGTVKAIADAGFQAISVDFPGYGKSERGNYTILSEFIRDLVQTLGVTRAYYLGASMGGEAVLGFALNNPEKVEGVILVGAVGVDKYKEKLVYLSGKKVLLIWGKEDMVAPIKNAKLIMDAVPTAKLVYVGRQHACYLDDPEGFNKEIIDFLKG
ncbi:MAG: alpha/beta hydrolase [Sulfolobales archaeon]|nr:alpha/beta hydrolase [Sulfolobales archaeon]MCG2884190.1 alpha/beta hydrolase [Sulfolobales archaeon]MCG2908704.1 alpha/beta hydrolase [Sulfolobales archaeon]MCQ4335481.1 alpha/beta hydrolase [Sulfolobales archaeon]MCQ4384792.1 alpha/beta hydrolase [Sulfolobales archaeon]